MTTYVYNEHDENQVLTMRNKLKKKKRKRIRRIRKRKKRNCLVTDPIYSIRQTVVHGLLMSIRKDGLQTRLMRHYLKISVSV